MSADGLFPFADGTWVATEPVRFLGLQLDTTMTVLRLRDNDLLLHSPVALTPSRRMAVEKLGRVAHLYAPNLYHHLWIGEWASAFPSARLHAPAGLARKRQDLRLDRRIDNSTPEPAFHDVIDELHINGLRLGETALFYRPSRTLIVADLIHNVGRPEHRWTKVYARTMGFYDRISLSRMIRWTAFSDKIAARRSIDQLLAMAFDALIVGHGRPVAEGARPVLAAAYSWLPPADRSEI